MIHMLEHLAERSTIISKFVVVATYLLVRFPGPLSLSMVPFNEMCTLKFYIRKCFCFTLISIMIMVSNIKHLQTETVCVCVCTHARARARGSVMKT